jgi:hypothetical protein
LGGTGLLPSWVACAPPSSVDFRSRAFDARMELEDTDEAEKSGKGRFIPRTSR